MKKEIISIKGLSVAFKQYEKNTANQTWLSVISDLDVTVYEGEITAVVGSSGSGKSLLAHAVMGVLPQNAKASGEIRFCGESIGKNKMEHLRGKEIAFVPQSINYLDPLMKIGAQLCAGKKDAAARLRMRELFERYGLENGAEILYPFELSGGMARRVLLLTALMNHPRLILADEPTPGMELALARKAMDDFRSFADEGNGVLMITHDLELALEVADRIVVFYAGTTVEEAFPGDFSEEHLLRHPYTRALFRAMPKHGFQTIQGSQPYAKDVPKGCAFAPRCPQRTARCKGDIPMLQERGGTVRCVLYQDEV